MMNLLRPILKILPSIRNNNCLKNPSDFFSSSYASKLAKSLNSAIPSSETTSTLETLALKVSRISGAEYTLITQFIGKRRMQVASLAHHNQILDKKDIVSIETQSLSSLLSDQIISSRDTGNILNSLNIKDPTIRVVTAMLLRDDENTPLGGIFIFTKKEKADLINNTLQFFSFFIASELRHVSDKAILEKKNLQLQKAKEELKNKNQLLDNLNRNLSKAKQIVDESNRLKSAFLANLSHEIRTPMNVIMGFTELLSAEDMSPNQRKNYIDIIQQNGTRLLNIMDSLIDISRFQAKKIANEQQPFSLNKILRLIFSNYLSEINISRKPLKLKITPGAVDGEDIVTYDKEAIYKVLKCI